VVILVVAVMVAVMVVVVVVVLAVSTRGSKQNFEKLPRTLILILARIDARDPHLPLIEPDELST
jgi:predicted PurR-regulated permease PerM